MARVHICEAAGCNNTTGNCDLSFFKFPEKSQRVNESAALLCNSEVLILLKNLQGDQKTSKSMKHQQNLATIIYETVKYLEQSPSAPQSPEAIENFLKTIARYNLTKAEKLQLLNQRPTTLVEIQLLIEESEERLNEEQMHEILSVVAQTLPDGQESEGDPPADLADVEDDL